MSEDTKSNTQPDWVGLAADLEHFDPFEGLTERISEEELKNVRYGFRIAGQNLLFDKSVPCEIIQYTPIYPVPNTPRWLSGLINVRGNLIPTIHMGTRVESEQVKPVKGSRKSLLIIDNNEDVMATFIDELPIALQIDEEVIEKVADFSAALDILQPHITTGYRVDEDIWYELDHRSFFGTLTAEIASTQEHDEPEEERADAT